jgi:hypothetical protein
MIEDRLGRYQTPRTLRRVRRTAPAGTQNAGLFLAGGIIGLFLIILLVTMGQRATVKKAGGGGDVNAARARLSDAPSPVDAAPIPAPTEAVLPATPKAQHKEACLPAQAEVKSATATESVIAARNPKKELEAEAPAPPPDLFPSAGISPLSNFVGGPDGQEGKADEIVRVVVDSLKITKSSSGKMGYRLVLRKTRILKGKTLEENANETLTLGATNGDPKKEFGFDPATATGKTLVLFLKNDDVNAGSFSFFGLTAEDYDGLKSKVTAAVR